jgi:hypothetical protein
MPGLTYRRGCLRIFLCSKALGAKSGIGLVVEEPQAARGGKQADGDTWARTPCGALGNEAFCAPKGQDLQGNGPTEDRQGQGQPAWWGLWAVEDGEDVGELLEAGMVREEAGEVAVFADSDEAGVERGAARRGFERIGILARGGVEICEFRGHGMYVRGEWSAGRPGGERWCVVAIGVIAGDCAFIEPEKMEARPHKIVEHGSESGQDRTGRTPTWNCERCVAARRYGLFNDVEQTFGDGGWRIGQHQRHTLITHRARHGKTGALTASSTFFVCSHISPWPYVEIVDEAVDAPETILFVPHYSRRQ